MLTTSQNVGPVLSALAAAHDVVLPSENSAELTVLVDEMLHRVGIRPPRPSPIRKLATHLMSQQSLWRRIS